MKNSAIITELAGKCRLQLGKKLQTASLGYNTRFL